ncbi:NPCBM/NEW2 domain protein [Gimesia panareensis]|uniref:NPCBM/NEW2 domain protein n=1 Tax=Gimesia panareensis TaxID=2527978 RepID=A0A518FNU6_9PLAN|nr:NPCBM/NEW2 domain-containing protein [Gimesia panareensis]QDV18036.1 NPCBM/NEW2 domain protein [Gimesia panareensis]
MHSLFCATLTIMLSASPGVEVTSLTGTTVSGQLQSINQGAIQLKQGQGDQQYPLAGVLNVRFPQNRFQRTLESPLMVRLADGSRFPVQDLKSTEQQTSLQGEQTGALTVPTKAVTSVRFGTLNSDLQKSWDKLLNSKHSKDLLVVQKENVLDYIDGVVGNITKDRIQFFAGEDEVAVNRQRVFGIIYFRPPAAETTPFCSIKLTDEGLLQATNISYNGTQFEATLQSGARTLLSPSVIANLDFSQGKVRYLSDLEPRDIEYTPFFDTVWKYRRDKHRDGGPLRVGGKEYSRGLYIHSKTLLKYRLKNEYRHFRAIMGIDDSVPGIGFVYVEIKGNGRTLYSGNVKSSDPPVDLDLDVSGVRDLEILVDFGDNLEICDHLDLCNARLIK